MVLMHKLHNYENYRAALLQYMEIARLLTSQYLQVVCICVTVCTVTIHT